MKKGFWFITLLFAAFSAVGQETIRVYAASSLTNVLNEIIERYQGETGNKVLAVYGGSSSLSRQLMNGAPGDIFISANTQWMEYLVENQRISRDNVTKLISNQLVVISGKSNSLDFDISDPQQWRAQLQGEWLALGDPQSVPAGLYAKQMLENLGVWESVAGHIAPSKNVRLALALVERGEAKLGVVYRTDATLSQKVTVLATPDQNLYDQIVYPAAMISHSAATEQFYHYLQSQPSQQVFAQYGFMTLGQQ